jgi:hypothetical protein
MLEHANDPLSLEGEGRVRVFDAGAFLQPSSRLSLILSPQGRGGAGV